MCVSASSSSTTSISSSSSSLNQKQKQKQKQKQAAVAHCASLPKGGRPFTAHLDPNWKEGPMGNVSTRRTPPGLLLARYTPRFCGVSALILLAFVTMNLAFLVALYNKGSGLASYAANTASPTCSAEITHSSHGSAKDTDQEVVAAATSTPSERIQVQDLRVMVAKDEISVSATSGSRPVSKDGIINLDHGDPTMYETFWKQMGGKGDLLIPCWQTMSYFSDVTNLCWFLEPELGREVRRLHQIVGNAVTDDYHIIVGTGSTQLLQAALYALSPQDATAPMSVVSAVPYYSSYPAITDFLQSQLFRWAGDANTFKGDSYIEIVCTPNNPDGFTRQRVLKSATGKTIHDLAYYWPQYTPITHAADHDIMLFTFSKSTGHAGTRLGWALVKDKDVAKKMMKFIELNTIGVSKDSQLRAAKILKVVSDAYELPSTESSERLFDFGRLRMIARWDKLREAVKASGIFSVPEYPSGRCKFFQQNSLTYPAFAWLKCELPEIEDCESFLKSHKILTRNGKHSGAGTKYVRVSMLDRDETFDIFVERLSSLQVN